MSGYVITFKDFRNLTLGSQVIATGATVAVAEANAVFAITSLFGSAILVKDAAGTTVIPVATQIDFTVPLVMRGGFTITGTNLAVVYSKVVQAT